MRPGPPARSAMPRTLSNDGGGGGDDGHHDRRARQLEVAPAPSPRSSPRAFVQIGDAVGPATRIGQRVAQQLFNIGHRDASSFSTMRRRLASAFELWLLTVPRLHPRTSAMSDSERSS